MPQIYLDNASTTQVDTRVLEKMLPYFGEEYGNPESLHQKGKEALIAVDTARETIAETLRCQPSEIIFTGSATEANNLAIFGIAQQHKNAHFITSKIEHASVLEVFKELEKEGHTVSYLKVDREGFISTEELKKALRQETKLVSIMYANNEIGAIEPVAEIGKICHDHKIPFHTDACQAAGALNLDVQKLQIDLMTLNSGKIYGPKGIGLLYVRQSIKLKPIMFGGGQEKGLRPGTHNVAAIVGFAKALELAQAEKETENQRLKQLRDQLIEELLSNVPNSRLNGPRQNRLPNNINIVIPGIEASDLLLHLSEAGIYASTGSACAEGQAEPSYVLTAIGLPEDLIHNSIRFTLGKSNTQADIKFTTETILKIFKKIHHGN